MIRKIFNSIFSHGKFLIMMIFIFDIDDSNRN